MKTLNIWFFFVVSGLILAQYVPAWVEQRRTIKLSQIIDMYYSEEGVSFQPTVKACNRQMLFNTFFNSSELLQETVRLAAILSLRQITVYIPVEEMERFANAAVTAFEHYLREYSFPNVSKMSMCIRK